MAMDDIQKKMLAPFIFEAKTTLGEMAGMKVDSGEVFEDKVEDFRFKGHAVAIRTHGKIEGVILLHNYIETALAISNRVRQNLLGDTEAHEEMNEEMQAALAEWGNIITGRATQRLELLKMGFTFEPPQFIYNTENMGQVLKGVREIISVPVHIDEVGRFFLNLLLYSEEDTSAKQAIALSEKVLIVDDSPIIRASMKKVVAALGYGNVIEADNGKEAVEKHASESPAIVFMDIVMPQMNGDEALAVIRDKDKETPIVMLSSVADQTVIEKCNSLGATGYIVKPFSLKEGPEILREYFQK